MFKTWKDKEKRRKRVREGTNIILHRRRLDLNGTAPKYFGSDDLHERFYRFYA
jgi:hypothetical protein